jgi:hypothetical protein
VAVTAGWGLELLRTDTSFHPWVRYLEVAAGVAAVALLAVAAVRTRVGRRLVLAVGVLTAVAVTVPTAAWAMGTAATPHSGSIPTAVSGSGSAGFGTGAGGGAPGGAPGGGGAGGAGATRGGAPGFGSAEAGSGGVGGSGTRGSSGPPSGLNGEFGGFRDGGAPTDAGAAGATGADRGGLPSGTSRGDLGGGAGGGFGGGSPGGATPSSALDKALEKTTTRWAAAVEGSSSAASLELSSGGKAVMAMGGFTGSDPAPTLAQFERWAKAGDITYYIAGGGIGGRVGGGPGGQGSSSQITAWVEAHYKSATIGGETVYLLLQPKS